MSIFGEVELPLIVSGPAAILAVRANAFPSALGSISIIAVSAAEHVTGSVLYFAASHLDVL